MAFHWKDFLFLLARDKFYIFVKLRGFSAFSLLLLRAMGILLLLLFF